MALVLPARVDEASTAGRRGKGKRGYKGLFVSSSSVAEPAGLTICLTFTQIEAITKKLRELKYNDVSEELVRYALNSRFANGDIDKAVEILQIQQKAFGGIIEPYNPNVQMLGAENRGNVTCYLDALLFAMFAKLSAFECMLKNDQTDESQRKLAALIRLWVNMLRTGKLIHTDMVPHHWLAPI